MRILRQMLIILGVWLVSEVLSRALSLPIPGNVLGMFIMLILLCTKAVKATQLSEVSNFFLENISLFFIPSVAAIVIYYKQVQDQVAQVLIALVVSSVLVFMVTGYTVEGLLYLKKKRQEKKTERGVGNDD